MKNLILFLTSCALYSLSTITYAQANLRIFNSSAGTTQTISQTNFGNASFVVQNSGDQRSRRFKVRIWLSTENSFTLDDQVDDGAVSAITTILNPDGSLSNQGKDPDGFSPGIEPTRTVNRRQINLLRSTARYTLPLAEDVSPTGRPKALSELLGKLYFYRACIVFEGTNACDPDPKHNATSSTLLVPPRVAFNGTRLLNDDPNEIKFVWPEVPYDEYVDDLGTDQSVNFVTTYRIWWNDENGVRSSREIAMSDLTVFKPGPLGEREFIITSTDLGLAEVGKRYAFRVESCTVAKDTGLTGCQANRPNTPNRSERYVAALHQTFAATDGSNNEGVLIQFTRPQVSTPRYIIERCNESGLECERTQFEPNTADEYLDRTAIRGRGYIYNLYACDSVIGGNGPTAGLCFNNDLFVYQFGTTNIGRIGLVDPYEVDDSPDQATLIQNSTSQLRSFHTSLDDDWVRIELTKTADVTINSSSFESTNVDTVLTLYAAADGNLEPLEVNDDIEQVASFSQIGPMTLEPGLYFVKSTHFKLIPDGQTEPIIPAPVIPNYFLNFTIDTLDAVNLMPIINLLLDD